MEINTVGKEMEDSLLKKFLIINFSLVVMLGIFLYFAKERGMELGNFAVLQMYFPAFAVILGILTSEIDLEKTAKRSYFIYIIFAILSMLSLIAQFFIKDFNLVNTLVVVFSVVILISFLMEGKDKKEVANLKLYSLKSNLLVILLFLLLYFLEAFLEIALTEGLGNISQLLSSDKLILLLLIILSFPLSFLPFLGEEYGWRFFLQPILQKKYGMRKGIILLGFIWGIWHLPLNLFYYSADGSQLTSILSQIGFCIAVGIFFAYAYAKTKSIWSVACIHYLNNNLVLLFSDKIDLSVIEGNVITWHDLVIKMILVFIVYGGFLFIKYNSKKEYRVDTPVERLNK